MLQPRERASGAQAAARDTNVLPDNAWVLTVYLDVDPTVGAWPEKQQHLRKVLDVAEKAMRNHEEQTLFTKARRAVEQFFRGWPPHGKGLAIFYAPELEALRHVEVPRPIPEGAWFQQGAFVAPLGDLLASQPRWGIVLVDSEHGRVIISHLGEVLKAVDVVDRVPKRHKQREFGQHIEQHHAVEVQRHLRHVVDTLNDLHNKNAFDYLIIGGASEAFPKFERELPPTLAALVRGRFTGPMYASDHEVMERALATIVV